jgi:Ca2+/H+ antiporter, TMEM165/GDT1 family
MDLRLFVSTFLLIFLAELGDKTQLTAMARAAGSDGGKWTVFLAAASALLLSTLLAVTLGRWISRHVPENIVRLLAAILFLCFGVLLLIGALQRTLAPAGPVPATEPAASGIMMRAILHIAAEFEEAAAADYASLARETTDPRIRELLLGLEAEEREHLRMMHAANNTHADMQIKELERSSLPAGAELQHDVAASDRPLLTHAIEHETATMQFYEELARRTPIPALRRTFTFLADAERDHIRRISAMLKKHSA